MSEKQSPGTDTDPGGDALITESGANPAVGAAMAPADDAAGASAGTTKEEDDLETQEVVAQIGIPD